MCGNVCGGYLFLLTCVRLNRDLHIKGFAYFSSLIALRQAGQSHDSSQYAYCLRYLFVSFYTWHEQARPQALEAMLLTDLNDAVNNVYFSEEFKTSSVYGYQPVTMNELVKVYVEHVRPKTTDCNAALFLTNTGSKLGQGYVTKALNTYFAHFGLNICVTTIRTLIEVKFYMF
jgi:hypothetical protein